MRTRRYHLVSSQNDVKPRMQSISASGSPSTIVTAPVIRQPSQVQSLRLKPIHPPLVPCEKRSQSTIRRNLLLLLRVLWQRAVSPACGRLLSSTLQHCYIKRMLMHLHSFVSSHDLFIHYFQLDKDFSLIYFYFHILPTNLKYEQQQSN